MKIRFTRMALAIILSLSFAAAVPAHAFGPVLSSPAVVEADSNGVAPRAEEIGYVYRTHNGVKQYRIWSFTYGYWLTDWIDC